MRALPLAVALALTILPASAAGMKRLQGFKVSPLPAAVVKLPIANGLIPSKTNPKPVPWFNGTFRPVHRNRFLSAGALNVWAPKPAAGPSMVSGFVMPVFDLQRRQFLWPVVDFSGVLPDEPTRATLLAYDEPAGQAVLTVTTLRVKETRKFLRTSQDPDGGTINVYKGIRELLYRTHLAHWDLASGRIDWTVPVHDEEEPQARMPLGLDPTGRYAYFGELKARTYDPENQLESVPVDAITLSRLDLTTRTIDWRHTVPLPGRDVKKNPLLGGLSIKPNADFTKFALIEYCEPSHGKVNPPPQGWIVDVPSNAHHDFEIPRLAYGLTFDRQNRYFLIGSHSEGKLFRYNLASRKRDLVVPAIPSIQQTLIAGDNRTLYVMNRRLIEQRSWPDLKLVRTYKPKDLAPPGQAFFDAEGADLMPDGHTLVLNETDNEVGMATSNGFYVLSL